MLLQVTRTRNLISRSEKKQKLTLLLFLSALQLFVSFGLLNYFFPLLPFLHPLFPIAHPHLPQIIPHIVFPSHSWPSLRSCCIRFPFVYGLGHSLIGHSFYMPQPAQSFVFYISKFAFHKCKFAHHRNKRWKDAKIHQYPYKNGMVSLYFAFSDNAYGCILTAWVRCLCQRT